MMEELFNTADKVIAGLLPIHDVIQDDTWYELCFNYWACRLGVKPKLFARWESMNCYAANIVLPPDEDLDSDFSF